VIRLSAHLPVLYQTRASFLAAMSSKLECLLANRERLKSEMAATKQQIKREQQMAEAAAKAASRQWQLTPWLKKVVLGIYVNAGYQAAPAVKFLENTASKRSWAEKGGDELERMVEDLFAEVDLEELVSWSSLEEPSDPSAIKQVLRYVQDWRAAEYVRDLNTRIGVAPSTEDILRKVEENRLQLPLPSRPESKGTAAEAKARMWAKRWREKWGGRYGKLRVQDDMTLAEMQQKDRFLEHLCFLFWQGRGPKMDPFLGPYSGPKFGAIFRPPYIIQ
jgi:hypothetical protein